MSNSIGLNNDLKKAEFAIKDIVSDNQCNVIIPYMPSGYEDYSNFGFVGGQYEIDNFLTYKRIYTGNDAFIITWKGTTFINKELHFDRDIQTTWQLGEYILGFNEGHYSNVSIEADNVYNQYKKFAVDNTITFRISAKYNLTENYKYLFYKVPEISKDIVYRVVSLDTEYEGRLKTGYVLTLKSLQQELENTGRAKSQNVMPSSPGERYIDPLIITKNELPDDWETQDGKFIKIDKDRYLTYDVKKFVGNNFAKYLVVKMFGLAILQNFTMVGRRKSYQYSEPKDYGIPQLIFPINLKQATTPTLYNTQQPSNNYYFVWNLRPIIIFKSDAFDAIKGWLDINKVWPHQGILQYDLDGNKPNFVKTNPIVDGNYKYTLYGIVQTPENLGGLTLYTPWAFDIGNKDLVFHNAGVFGSALEYKIYGNETRKIHDYLWDSYWTQKKVRTLPLSKENTLTFGNVLGSGIQGLITGGALGVIAGSALFTIGLLGTLTTKLDTPKAPGVMGIVPAELIDFMVNEASGSIPNLIQGTNWFKLSYFLNSENNEFLTFFNTKTMNTSFEAELTTQFQTKNFKGQLDKFNTMLIGQTHLENGQPVFNSGLEPLLVEGGEKLLVEDDDTGFVIDSFNLQAIFNGDFSVEFLNKDREVIWSGVYQSEAKWTDSIREINTWRNTSIYGRENIFLDKPKPWPNKVSFPTKWGVANDIDVSIKDFRQYLYHDGVSEPKSLSDMWSHNTIGELGWGVKDNEWNQDTYTGEKTSWVVNQNNNIPRFPKAELSFSLLRKNDIELLKSNVYIEPKAFWEKYGDIYINYKINGKTQRLKIFSKSNIDDARDEGTYVGISKNREVYDFPNDNVLVAHMGSWAPAFDGDYEGANDTSTYKFSKGGIGSSSTTPYAMHPIMFFKENAHIDMSFKLKFKKDGGIFLDIDITRFWNEYNGLMEMAKENFQNSQDYQIPNNVTIDANVPRGGSPTIDHFYSHFGQDLWFGTLPIKKVPSRKKGSSDFNKPPIWEKTKSIGYVVGFEGVNIECKVLE